MNEKLRQAALLRFPKPCPKCGRGVGEFCVSRITGKRKEAHVARLNGHYKNIPLTHKKKTDGSSNRRQIPRRR